MQSQLRSTQHQARCMHFGHGHQLMRPFQLQGIRGQTRRNSVIVRAAETPEKLLTEGKRFYEAGDRLSAMQMYEKVLKGSSITQQQRFNAMFGSIAVHASFGDIELAQMVLRDAVLAGMDFEAAKEDPINPDINSSPQIAIQLSRFNKLVLRQIENKQDEQAATSAKFKAQSKRMGGSSSRVSDDADLSSLLGPGSGREEDAIDASPLAIAKRVALVLLAGVFLGTALFFLGLEYMFPKI